MPRTPRTPKTPVAPRPAEDTRGAVDLTRRKDETRRDADPHPHMPHERDESVGMTDGKPDPRMRQGQRDVQRGVQDTSRAPEADRTYEKFRKG